MTANRIRNGRIPVSRLGPAGAPAAWAWAGAMSRSSRFMGTSVGKIAGNYATAPPAAIRAPAGGTPARFQGPGARARIASPARARSDQRRWRSAWKDSRKAEKVPASIAARMSAISFW